MCEFFASSLNVASDENSYKQFAKVVSHVAMHAMYIPHAALSKIPLMISRSSTSRGRPLAFELGSKSSIIIIPRFTSLRLLGYALRVMAGTTTLLLQNQFSLVAIALFCSLCISFEIASERIETIYLIVDKHKILTLFLRKSFAYYHRSVTGFFYKDTARSLGVNQGYLGS